MLLTEFSPSTDMRGEEHILVLVLLVYIMK